VSRPDDKAVVIRRAEPLPRSAAPPAGVANVLPELVRVAAVSWWRAMSWSVETTAGVAGAVLRRATSGEPPTAVLAALASDARGAAWRALGVAEHTDAHGVPEVISPAGASPQDLRAQGSELLRRSNDVHVVEDTHPAFARILAEITPDEARILRFLYLNGPQPAVDVRTNRPLGVGSQLVEGGLNLIGEQAGCRNVERVHPYLTNLFRLGMVEFPKEQVSNPQRYQLVEAQPKVVAALKRAGRWPRTVRRSILLSSFGEEFCRTCLPLDARPAVPGTGVELGTRPDR
jgi:abortive infection alpha-like protein